MFTQATLFPQTFGASFPASLLKSSVGGTTMDRKPQVRGNVDEIKGIVMNPLFLVV